MDDKVKKLIAGGIIICMIFGGLMILLPHEANYPITIHTNLPGANFVIKDINKPFGEQKVLEVDLKDTEYTTIIVLPVGNYTMRTTAYTGTQKFFRDTFFDIPLKEEYDEDFDIFVEL